MAIPGRPNMLFCTASLFSGWRKCERHVACHSNGELPRVFSTLEWRATLFAGINWKIMMPGSISDFKIDEANKPQK
jgi:hypothetical protein